MSDLKTDMPVLPSLDKPLGYKAGTTARKEHRAKMSLGATGDPKGEAGAAKPQLDNISLVAQYYEAAVMQTGAEKYGAYNWCDHPMKASTYYNAILRHLQAWWQGETFDLESELPHMAHLRSCTGIIMEQQASGKLIDDRPKQLVAPARAVECIKRAKANRDD